MVNERKTEDIVREILKENKKVYEKETKGFVYIEEQKSDNPSAITSNSFDKYEE